MATPVMGGQLILHQPPGMIPTHHLLGPAFNNGRTYAELGVTGYQTATGRVVTLTPQNDLQYATGCMITPNIVLTAAHVVAPAGKWKNEILFQPAFNNGWPMIHHERVRVRAAFIPARYFTPNKQGKDYAILVMEKALPSEALYTPVKLHPAAGLNIPAFAIGYPAVPDSPNQHLIDGHILWANALQLGHDMYELVDGFSGSALTAHQFSDGRNVLVGIHSSPRKASLVSDAMLAEIAFVYNSSTPHDLNPIS